LFRVLLAVACVATLSLSTGDAAAGGVGGGNPSSGAGGNSGGVCDTGLTTGDEGIDLCLSEVCCEELTGCEANPECQACLIGDGTACDTNNAYQDWLSCSDGICASEICETRIAFTSNGAPAYKCNACANQCCSCIQGCVGGGTDPEIDFCLECLAAPRQCPDPIVAAWAINFHACSNESCATECGATSVMGGDPAVCQPAAEGGAGGAGGSGGAAGGAESLPAPPTDSSSCSCSAPGQSHERRGWLFAAAVAAAGLVIARRVRRRAA
jgi:MYXO-CTERM domain-containing protein